MVVLGLAAAVAHHRPIAVVVREGRLRRRLGQRSDLVDLHGKALAAPRSMPSSVAPVGDEQIVSDDLDAVADGCVSSIQPSQSSSDGGSSMDTSG